MSTIGVHLWAHAPGCDVLPSNSEQVWRWFMKPPAIVLRTVLQRLQLAPAFVELKLWQHHDGHDWIDVLGEIEGDILNDDDTWSRGPMWVPLASFHHGVDFDAMSEAREDLILAGWKPRPAQPSTKAA